MRATVLNDPALAKQAGRFVWLSINTEDRRNAEFVKHAAVDGLPTYLVEDARDEEIALRWLGSATAPQLAKLLDDGERAVSEATAGDPATQALARADRLDGEHKSAEAIEAYKEALKLAAPDWPRRARCVTSLVLAAAVAGDEETCARTAIEEAPSLPRDTTFANVTGTGLGCAEQAPEEAEWRADALAALEPMVVEALDLDGVLADDRSSLYGALVDLHDERGDTAGSKELAERWLSFLESETAKAPDAESRAAFDSHRIGAALALGQLERVVPALLASERDLPDDYNPPARLAFLYGRLGQYDAALAAADRALARADGPRKLRIYDTRADVLTKKGDTAGARTTLEEALRFADGLPEPQQPKRLVAHLQTELDALP